MQDQIGRQLNQKAQCGPADQGFPGKKFTGFAHKTDSAQAGQGQGPSEKQADAAIKKSVPFIVNMGGGIGGHGYKQGQHGEDAVMEIDAAKFGIDQCHQQGADKGHGDSPLPPKSQPSGHGFAI